MSKENPARVILKADDYGNQTTGIIELVSSGRLTSVGSLIAFTGRAEADKLLQAAADSPFSGTSLVLHTNFQSGTPVAGAENVPSLVDTNGRFLRPEPVAAEWEAYRKHINPHDAKRELDAQIEKFYQEYGRYPDALDSHNIILAVEPLAEVAIQTAAELDKPITFPYLYADEFGPGPLAAQKVHTELLREYKRSGIKTADHTYPDDNGEHVYLNSVSLEDGARKLASGLQTLRPGVTQIVFHPVHPDAPRIPSDTEAIRAARSRDYDMLTDPTVSTIIFSLNEEKRLASYNTL